MSLRRRIRYRARPIRRAVAVTEKRSDREHARRLRPRSRTRAVRGFAGGIFTACGSSVISQRNLLSASDQGTALQASQDRQRRHRNASRSPVPVVAKSTSPNRPGCVGIRSAMPRTSGWGASKPSDRESRTATWLVPASSSQGTPVLPTAPARPITPSKTSPRGWSAFLPRALPSRKTFPPELW
jgi:hypothetical protein